MFSYKLSGEAAEANTPVEPRAEVEMRIVARDETGTLLFLELLPLRGLALAPGVSSGTGAQQQPATLRPAYPSELHLLCDDELTGHEGLPILFAVSPQDVVVAQPRGPADHAEWEFGRGRYHRAIAIAMANVDDVPAARRRVMVERYISELVAAGDHARAADVCLALVQPEDAESWNRWVCAALAPSVPARVSAAAKAAPAPAPVPATVLQGSWHFLRAAVLCYGIDVGEAPSFAADGHVDLLAAGDASHVVELDVRRAGGGATAAPLAPATCTRVLEYLIARDARTFVAVLRAVHARAAVVASKSGAGQAPSYDVDQTTFTVEDLLERLKGARAGAEADGGAGANARAAARGSALSEGLLELYLVAERFEDALRLLLAERSTLLGAAAPGAAAAAAMARFSGRMFSIIEERRLYSIVAENVDELLGIDEARTLAMIAEHLDEFPVDRVALQLQEKPQRLLVVLEHLFSAKEEAYNAAAYQPFLDVQVQLYAQFARARLLPFLRRCKHYSLEAAEAVCAAAQPPLHEEHAFLLVKGGKGKEAVALQLDALGDVAAAVATANEFNDEDIWSALVQRTLQLAVATRNGALVGTLLDSISNSPLDPVQLISRIPVSIPILDLHERLAAIIRDRRLHRGMVAICAMQCRDDVMGLITRMTRGHRQGLGITADARCALCDEALSRARTARVAAGSAAATAAASNEDGDAADEGAAAAAPAAAVDEDNDGAGEDARPTATGAGMVVATTASALDAEDLARSIIFFCQHAFHLACLREYQAKALAAAAAAAAAVAAARPAPTRARGSSVSGDRAFGGDGVFGRVVSAGSGSGGGRGARGRGRRGSDASSQLGRERDEEGSSVGGGSTTAGQAAFKASQYACPYCTAGLAGAAPV